MLVLRTYAYGWNVPVWKSRLVGKLELKTFPFENFRMKSYISTSNFAVHELKLERCDCSNVGEKGMLRKNFHVILANIYSIECLHFHQHTETFSPTYFFHQHTSPTSLQLKMHLSSTFELVFQYDPIVFQWIMGV